MALLTPSLLLLTSSFLPRKNHTSESPFIFQRGSTRRVSVVITATSSKDNNASEKPTKLITFLGKGGSGKTTSAVFAAQHYAMSGLKTCLITHSQDPTAEYLLNHKIGTSPVTCNTNLSAVRLETTKLLLEPLRRLKQADARLNMTQGVLEGVVGEELGVLPGMDSIFSALALARLVGFLGDMPQKSYPTDKFDIIIYDGICTEETIRMMGATSKARLYLKYMRNLAEKTDLGRLAGPSLLRLVDESLSISSRSVFNGNISSEVWNDLEQTLEKGSYLFAQPDRFACYLVMNPNNPASLKSALRYWGCTIQAGAQVSGAFSIVSSSTCLDSAETIRKSFSPLPFAFAPNISVSVPIDWNEIMLNPLSKESQGLLTEQTNGSGTVTHSIKFDPTNKSVTLFMPGFDKSEIKLYQYRGQSELLVEAGDQRRVICLPSQIQGKVGGAKFIDRNLIITMG